MTIFNSSRIAKTLAAASLSMTLLAGCMTPEELAALDGAFDMSQDGPDVPAPAVSPSCFNERFVQPEAEISRSIDILFVMDTSGSMSDNRRKVAEGISAFVSELPHEVDYQVGVMLAHGSKSAWSGKLYKHAGNTVFSSKTKTIETISAELKAMVLGVPTDAQGEQGEEGAYSLVKGLTSNLAANRQAGFFRESAALAVVFVADENDICAPDYGDKTQASGMTQAELKLRNRDCPGGIATGDVIAKVRSVQGDRPYLFGGVVHKTAGYTDTAGNDGYGFGYMDAIKATNGVSTEINDGEYTEGLSNMGKLATSKLNLVLDFTLARAAIKADSISVRVDGAAAPFVYDATSNEVHLTDGGRARSVVDLNYCLQSESDLPPNLPVPQN